MARSWKGGLPTLRQGRISLREIQPEDEDPIVELFRDPRVSRHLADPPRSRKAFRQFIKWSADTRLAGRYTGFAVRQSGRTVGMMYVWVVAPGTAEIGFALTPPMWGTGLFRVAGGLLCRFAFEVMKLHRLEMRVAVQNTRAQVAVYKLGATPEGVLRDSFIKDGRHYDSVMFRLLRPEFTASRGSRP
jgi:RimJ/RimL family protein N-acetyltransferase